MIQGKAQSEENGESFSRTATPYWIIWIAPFGRTARHSPALLGFGKELRLEVDPEIRAGR